MEIEIRRKIVHALGVYSVLLILIFGRLYAAGIMLALTAIGFAMAEYRKNKEKYKLVRIKKLDEFEDAIENGFRMVERKNTLPFKGAIEFGIGCFLATILFTETVAIACIAVLALADAMSTLVGYYFGRHKLPTNSKKTWEGSTAFFATSLAILLLFVNPAYAVLTKSSSRRCRCRDSPVRRRQHINTSSARHSDEPCCLNKRLLEGKTALRAISA